MYNFNPLYAAIKNNDTQKVQKMLPDIPLKDYQDFNEWTYLHCIGSDQTQMFKILSSSPLINKEPLLLSSALEEAIQYDRLEMAQFLAGMPQLNVTAGHLFHTLNNHSILRVLVDHATLHHINDDERSYLFKRCLYQKNTTAFKILTKIFNPNPHANDLLARTPDPDIISLLYPHCDPNQVLERIQNSTVRNAFQSHHQSQEEQKTLINAVAPKEVSKKSRKI